MRFYFEKLIYMMIAFVMLLLSSCGGIESENINYTKYNAYSTNHSTTTTSNKNANLTTSKIQITTKIKSTVSNKSLTSKTIVIQPTVKQKDNSQNAKNKNIPKGNSAKKGKQNSNNKTTKKPDNNVVAGVVANGSGNENSSNADDFNDAGAVQGRTIQEKVTTTLAPLLDTDICYITNQGKKFHRQNCKYLYKSSIKIIVKDAKEQGYSPCSVCKPQ